MLGDIVTAEVLAVSFAEDEHHAPLNARIGVHRIFNAVQLHTQAADLDLTVISAAVHDLARVIEIRNVAAAVSGNLLIAVCHRNVRLAGLFRQSHIACADTVSGDDQLTPHVLGQHIAEAVPDEEFRIRVRSANRHIASVQGTDADGHAGLGRSVGIEHNARKARVPQLFIHACRERFRAEDHCFQLCKDLRRLLHFQDRQHIGRRAFHHVHAAFFHRLHQQHRIVDLILRRHHNGLAVIQRHHLLNDRHIKGNGGKRQKTGGIVHIGVRQFVFVVVIQQIAQVPVGDLHALRIAGRTGGINAVRRIAFFDPHLLRRGLRRIRSVNSRKLRNPDTAVKERSPGCVQLLCRDQKPNPRIFDDKRYPLIRILRLQRHKRPARL